MKRGSSASNLTASPVLVGAVTLLVTLVAVYLSYNANSGLPFVPTYDLKADVPNVGQPGARQRRAHRRRARGHRQQDLPGAQRQRQAHARSWT